MSFNPYPTATYRLQFNNQFTFKDAALLIDYFKSLGISHCYASPIFAAKKGSTHGYDVIDHSRINEALGSEADFESFVKNLKNQGLGLILDIVPNHMGVMDLSNRWWYDLLENGRNSKYAEYFDVYWDQNSPLLDQKILLPILGSEFGTALEAQKIRLTYEDQEFLIRVNDWRLPTSLSTWSVLLSSLSERAAPNTPFLVELESIRKLLAERQQAAELRKVAKEQLHNLFIKFPEGQKVLEKLIKEMNGQAGVPQSFEKFEEFLNGQHYRLAYWRIGNEEINYRRFFDLFDYAALKMDNQETFQKSHQKISELIEKNWIQGVRIDHIDGLWDPEQYLIHLKEYCTKGRCYTIAEKILIGREPLPLSWELQGTVGYDYLNLLNGIFCDKKNVGQLISIYKNFIGQEVAIETIENQCKKLILETSLASELRKLTLSLLEIAISHRSSRDFTYKTLEVTVKEVLASFPVYRTYIRPEIQKIEINDSESIKEAIDRGKTESPGYLLPAFDFLQQILLLEHPEEIAAEQKLQRERFVVQFQQLSGPVMAKGIEDTAFYRFYPLASHNEVGCELAALALSIPDFHERNRYNQYHWPLTMLATTTHDTKRSEDVRARINVLSEIPEDWQNFIYYWSEINERYKVKIDENKMAPDLNEEYLLYQTILGTWPLNSMDGEELKHYVERIKQYMEKAIKEAKINSSWIDPHAEWDRSVATFIEYILSNDEKNDFLDSFIPFVKRISRCGLLNSISQTLLKLTSPGIPDIYQGNEIWDFSLVDPDNRRPVDFDARKRMIESLQEYEWDDLEETIEDGRIKLYVIQRVLNLRRSFSELFLEGAYLPLEVIGPKKDHLIAFARVSEEKGQVLIVIAGRFFSQLLNQSFLIDPSIWRNTTIRFPEEIAGSSYRNLFSLKPVELNHSEIALEKLFNKTPFALLEGAPLFH